MEGFELGCLQDCLLSVMAFRNIICFAKISPTSPKTLPLLIHQFLRIHAWAIQSIIQIAMKHENFIENLRLPLTSLHVTIPKKKTFTSCQKDFFSP